MDNILFYGIILYLSLARLIHELLSTQLTYLQCCY